MTTFGEKLRELMNEQQISQRKMSGLVPCDDGYLSRIARDLRTPSQEMAERLDEILGADGALAALKPEPSRPRRSFQGRRATAMGTVTFGSIPDLWGDDMQRRAALQLLTTIGVSVGMSAAAPLHRRLTDLVLTSAPHDLGDWHLACIDHLHALRTRPASLALEDLVTDLLALSQQLDTAEAGDLTELQRVQAALAMLHAHMSNRLGDHGSAIRWWRTARSAADSTGDLDLRLMIRCEEAKVGLYGQRDLETVLALVRQTEHLAGDAPSFWKADLAGTRAKAFTILGQHDQAMKALQVNVDYGGPDTPPSILPNLWVEDQPRFAQSWVYAAAGNEQDADQARDQVLAIARRRGGDTPYETNVRLHEAMCTIVKGGTDRGMKQAAQILDGIPADRRTQMTTAMGHFVLRAVPLDQQLRPTVREFRGVLARTAPRPALASGT
ncbi:helix-turn-helix domain-containing protein [Actinomadura macra]|uniref:helix-turn-helix domain-containing protein n=1 Tax=Actinomadura macra TaxID=46164 RepID=UPI00082C1F37|nr:helix-turn-helix transcriptional regulator [Actinomadura macra]